MDSLTTASRARTTQEQWDPHSIAPFPAVALKALNMVSGANTSLIELCDLIRSDPGFSTEILKIANSPLIAFPKNVSSVLQASMLLGFERLRTIVVTVGLKTYLGTTFTALTQACWRHSLACAIIAERAAALSFLDKDFAYTAGILHDIGRIALATIMPARYDEVVKQGAGCAADLLRRERELCGIDHCQAGGALVSLWNLPEAFLGVATCHHNSQAPTTSTAALIAPSCELADTLAFSVIPYRSTRSYGEIVAAFPERARNRFPADAAEFASEIAREIKVIESA